MSETIYFLIGFLSGGLLVFTVMFFILYKVLKNY